MNLHDNARDLLDHYILRLRRCLALHSDLDAREVEDDVRTHVFDALHDVREPVGAPAMQRVLDAMGHPSDWSVDLRTPTDGATGTSPQSATRRDDWHLSYISLTLLLLAFALPPFLWIGVFGAFLAARASLSAATHAARPNEVAGQHWLRSPALLAAYVPAMMLLLLWPAIAVRLAADFVVDHANVAMRLPIETAWLAERIAQIRLSNFDPSTTLDFAVRSGHWLIFPVGCWLILLAGIVRLAPRSSARVFRPFVSRNGRTLAGTLLFCGLLLAASALALALLKHTVVHGVV